MSLKIRINGDLVGKRLDEALPSLGFASSRSKGQSLIKEGKVFVNGKSEKAHYILLENDEVSGEAYVEKPTLLEKEDIKLDIVYEDSSIMVINKPAGLLVHPGAGHHNGTVANALAYLEEDLPTGNGVNRPGLVHRIDKDTSGLLAIAKTEKAFSFLSKQLSDHSMHREYYALVKGIILEDDGKIIAPIGRDKKRPLRNAVDVKEGKEAITYFHVEKRFRESDVTLVSCCLLTGRTHQIRVHMEYIGHPVIGDPLYGKDNRHIKDDGQLLHAYRLSFIHPDTNKEVSFEAPLPSYFNDILKTLK